jgi:hypothetical protein
MPTCQMPKDTWVHSAPTAILYIDSITGGRHKMSHTYASTANDETETRCNQWTWKTII